MSLKIGVSGIRGIIGDSLTEKVISDFAKAYGTFVGATRRVAPTILVGRDTRQSGEFCRKVVMDGLLSTGCAVTDVGLAPTPTVLFLTRQLKADGAIIITASHNPAQWNGLKFVRPDGAFLTKQEVGKLISIYNSKKFKLPANKRCTGSRGERPFAPTTLHLDSVVKAVDASSIKKAKFNVALDYCNGTGAVTTPYLLKKLGCNVVAVNTKPDGKFAHNPEPTPKNLEQLAVFVKESKADVGFAQDPDADRLAVVSEKGVPIGEENTLALAVKHVLSNYGGDSLLGTPLKEVSPQKKAVPAVVVVNLSTSRMIDDICEEFGATLFRSAVGETNVVGMMREKGAVIGGEGNGGVIYPAVNFGRDSFIGMALILEYMAKSNKKVSELARGIKQYHIEKTKIDCPQEKIKGILKNIKNCRGVLQYAPTSINTIDGVKIDYPDGWVHIRGSNTEPVIRIMAEAPDKETALGLIDKVKGFIQC